jgi:hypothetical protein
MLNFFANSFWWNLMPFSSWFWSDMPQIYVAKDVEAACETSSSSHYGFQDLSNLMWASSFPCESFFTDMVPWIIVDSNENLLNTLILLVLGTSSQSCGIYHCQTQYIKYQLTNCVESCMEHKIVIFLLQLKHVIILIVSNSSHFHLNYLLGFYWVFFNYIIQSFQDITISMIFFRCEFFPKWEK